MSMILQVLTLRKELGTHHEAVAADPGSARAKRAFDKVAKKLCEKLNELDRMVADSVVDQVTDIFVETSGPLNHLVQAATATAEPQQQRLIPTPPSAAALPPPKPSADYRYNSTPPAAGPPIKQQLFQEEVDSASSPSTKKMAELFRRHSRRLSQVAAHAAQSSTDAESEHQVYGMQTAGYGVQA